MAEPARDSFGALPSRPISSKFNRAWLTMLGSGALAAVLFIAATSANNKMVPVLVAKRAIAQGESFSANDFVRTSVHLQGNSGAALIINSNSNVIASLGKQRASRPITKGSLLTEGDFTEQSPDNSQRWFSLQIESADAVAGDLATNDEIDIFDKCGQQVGYKIRILSVSRGSSGGIGSSGSSKLTIKVSVDDAQISAVIRQVLSDRYEIVKNNGRPDLRPANPVICGAGGR